MASFDAASVEQKLNVLTTLTRSLIKPNTPKETVDKLLYRIASRVESIPGEYQSLQQQANQQLAELLELYSSVTVKQANDTTLVDSTLDPNATINMSLGTNLEKTTVTILEEQLMKVETCIRFLMALFPSPSSQSSPLLIEKLHEFMALVRLVPQTEAHLYMSWNKKLTEFLSATAHIPTSSTWAFVNPPVNYPVTVDIVGNLQRMEHSIDLLISLESTLKDVRLMKLSDMKQLMEQISSDNVLLKEQWNDKFRQLKDKCADSSEMNSSSDGTSQSSSRLSSTESIRQVPTEPSNDKIDQHDLDTSDLVKEEEEIRKLMYLEPVAVALFDEKIANLMEALDKPFAILDSTKWLNKIGQLVIEYVERRVPPENELHQDKRHSTAEGSTNIGYKIKQAFNKLAPIDEKLYGSDEYLVAISNLIELVGKTRKIVSVLDSDNKVLQREALDLAVSKSSININTQYEFDLSFLIYRLSCLLNELTQPPSGTSPANVCYYCKLPGHFVAQCPKVELIICFHCFKRGHHTIGCRNEEATAEELLANL